MKIQNLLNNRKKRHGTQCFWHMCDTLLQGFFFFFCLFCCHSINNKSSLSGNVLNKTGKSLVFLNFFPCLICFYFCLFTFCLHNILWYIILYILNKMAQFRIIYNARYLLGQSIIIFEIFLNLSWSVVSHFGRSDNPNTFPFV